MKSRAGAVRAAVTLGVVAIALTSCVSWFSVRAKARQVPPDPPPAPYALLQTPIPDGPQAGQLRRGRYLVTAGDCISCHTRAGGQPFAGGLGLRTPFGVIFSANLTGDREHGIGAYTEEEFHRAMSRGVARGGEPLYPAFPFDHFTLVTRQDTDAMLAWLKTVPPSNDEPPANLLPFPLNLRPALIAWKALFFRDRRFQDDPAQSAAWNRGAYLVRGLGHCGACHTPRNVAGAEQRKRRLRGADLNDWWAPDLGGDPRAGLGRWSEADIVEFLRTGRNARANAGGPMAQVVAYSTSLLTDEDLSAIATYLKSLPVPGGDRRIARADPAAMRRGAQIYSDACASCHLADGRGQPRRFPPLPGNAGVQQPAADGVARIILTGVRTAPTPARPTAFTMPSFAWKLDDQEIADVATFVRNSWGNRAEPAAVDRVARLRRDLRLVRAPTRPPPASADRTPAAACDDASPTRTPMRCGTTAARRTADR